MMSVDAMIAAIGASGGVAITTLMLALEFRRPKRSQGERLADRILEEVDNAMESERVKVKEA